MGTHRATCTLMRCVVWQDMGFRLMGTRVREKSSLGKQGGSQSLWGKCLKGGGSPRGIIRTDETQNRGS